MKNYNKIYEIIENNKEIMEEIKPYFEDYIVKNEYLNEEIKKELTIFHFIEFVLNNDFGKSFKIIDGSTEYEIELQNLKEQFIDNIEEQTTEDLINLKNKDYEYFNIDYIDNDYIIENIMLCLNIKGDIGKYEFYDYCSSYSGTLYFSFNYIENLSYQIENTERYTKQELEKELLNYFVENLEHLFHAFITSSFYSQISLESEEYRESLTKYEKELNERLKKAIINQLEENKISCLYQIDQNNNRLKELNTELNKFKDNEIIENLIDNEIISLNNYNEILDKEINKIKTELK